MQAQNISAPLSGLTVLDFSELLPGPFLTQTLVEMGATVIKIERPPHGDNARRLGPGLFASINRGKQSLLVDLKDEAQRVEVRALMVEADVVVESYRPGVMARLGLDYASVREACPRLVYVSLSGYGQTGPYADLPGHDINYLAVAGALAVSGPVAGGPEQSFGLPVADLCGAMYGLSATLAALYQRQIMGVGQYLDVALADCALHWMNPRLGTYAQAGLHMLQGQREATLVKPAYGAFRCRDGAYVAVAALEDHFWQRLTGVLDLGLFGAVSYREHPARKKAAAAINDALAAALSRVDSGDAFRLLAQQDIPVSPVVEPDGLATFPQFAERHKMDASGETALARFPVPLQGMEGHSLTPSPVLNSARSAAARPV